MTNPVWDGIEIDYDALDGYGWRVKKVSIDSVDYPLFLGYQVAALRELENRLENAGEALTATSSSPLTIGTGAKSIVIEPAKGFGPGTPIIVADYAAPAARWEMGVVTAYDGETGTLSYSVIDGNTLGSGSGSSWSIGITGQRGPIGPSVDGLVQVSAGDSTPSVLENAILAGAGIELTKNSPGGDESLTLSVSDDLVDELTALYIALNA